MDNLPGWGRMNGPSGELITPNSRKARQMANRPLGREREREKER